MRFEIAFERGSSDTYENVCWRNDEWETFFVIFAMRRRAFWIISLMCNDALFISLFILNSQLMTLDFSQNSCFFPICLSSSSFFCCDLLCVALKNNWKEIESFWQIFCWQFLWGKFPRSHCGVTPDIQTHIERKLLHENCFLIVNFFQSRKGWQNWDWNVLISFPFLSFPLFRPQKMISCS